jgi:hypothetical protein
MSSMLWAAAALAAGPAPMTAEELIERARSYYSAEEPAAAQICPEPSEGEIVVCGEAGDSDRYRVPSDTDRGVPKDEVPRAPNVSGLPDCSSGCMRVGKTPRRPLLIDLDTIPEAPPGSDADKIAKGEMAAP